MKKDKLNDLRLAFYYKGKMLQRLEVSIRDAQCMIPGDHPNLQVYVKSLKIEIKNIDDDLVEAEAKNRLYFLLGERTRHEHMVMEQKVRETREMKDNCYEDYVTLSAHMHEIRAEKEESEREYQRRKKIYDEARKDWQKKLKERRREVRELEKRIARERDKEEKKKIKALEKEKLEKEQQKKIQAEQQAQELKVQALAPKIEAIEASWNHLRTVSGAETPDDVISYWEGLKAKEESMHEMVKIAEKREVAAKFEIRQLLEQRADMFESQAGDLKDDPQRLQEDRQAIEEAQKKIDISQNKYKKLNTVCIAAEQGLKSLLARLKIALEEVPLDAKTAQSMGALMSRRFKGTQSTQSAASFQQKAARDGKSANRQANSPQSPTRSSPKRSDQVQGADENAQDMTAGRKIEEGDLINENRNDSFFPNIVSLVQMVNERLGVLLEIEQQIVSAKQQEAGEAQQGAYPMSELQLLKHMPRRTWTGAPYFENISFIDKDGKEVLNVISTNRPKKGPKKKKDTFQPDLTKIVGYTGPEIEPEGQQLSDDENETGEWDGLVDRDFLKHRAMKLMQKHESQRKQRQM